MNVSSRIFITILCLLGVEAPPEYNFMRPSAPYLPLSVDRYNSNDGGPAVNVANPRAADLQSFTNDDSTADSIIFNTRVVIDNMKREMPESIGIDLNQVTGDRVPIHDRADRRLCNFVEANVKQSMCARVAREIYGKHYRAVTFLNTNLMPPTSNLANASNPLACVCLQITRVFKSRYMFYCNDPILEDANGNTLRGVGFFVLGSETPNKIYGLKPTPPGRRSWTMMIFGIRLIYHYEGLEDPGTVDPVFEFHDSLLYEPLLENPYYHNGQQYLFKVGNSETSNVAN